VAARNSIIAAALLAVAEIDLTGVWLWSTIAVACLLSVYPRSERTEPLGVGRGAAVLVLTACAALTRSPVFLVFAALFALPRQRPHSVVMLGLAALGCHLLYWRYLAGFDPMRLPTALAAVASASLGRWMAILPEGVVIHGQTIRFSVVPLATVSVPIVLAALHLQQPHRRILRLALGSVLAFSTAFGVSLLFALSGHVHFFSAGAWPLVMVGAGISALAVFPTDWRLDVPTFWGRWTTAAVLLGLVWNWGIGPRTEPLRIVFDEAHGKWETVDAPLNSTEYGRHTVYNYVLMRQWLETKHTVTTLTRRWQQIDSDVLIVKMPVEYYSPEEKLAIDDFVRAGGLLLVIGDHTNLYGTAFVINDLLHSYGFEIEATATVPWDSPHYDFRPAWWQRNRYLAGVEVLTFQTAATITAHSPTVLPVIVADRVGAEDADYSNERFFGALHPGPEDRHPPIALAAERRVGKGRIVLFADSTIFSTFSFMSPGNVDLFQNLVERGVAHRGWLRLTMFMLVVVAAILLSPQRLTFALALLPPLLAFSAYLSRGDATAASYPGSWINFDDSHSRIELRADPRDEHGPAYDDYSTFFAWVARTGSFPRLSKKAFVDPTIPAVVLNPDRPFSAAELEAIEHYVKRGGRMLVMDDPRFATRSTVVTLLERFGVGLARSLPSTSLHDAGPPVPPANVFALPLEFFRYDRRTPAGKRATRIMEVDVPTGLNPLFVDDCAFHAS